MNTALSKRRQIMKSNVFVVTEGCYSDYHICAIFDSEELAKKYCDVHGVKYSDYEYDEWPINDWDTEEIARKHYKCWMYIESGEIKTEFVADEVARPELRLVGHPLDPIKATRFYTKGLTSPSLAPYIYGNSYISKEHARKVASDRRTILLAERAEGIRDENFIRVELQSDAPQNDTITINYKSPKITLNVIGHMK